MPLSSLSMSLRRSPSFLLLLSLVLLLLIVPVAEASEFHRLLINILFALVLLSAVWAVADRVWQQRLAGALVVVWLACELWSQATTVGNLDLVKSVLFLAFGLLVMAVLLRRIAAADKVDFEILCALPSVYLLFAIACALCFEALQRFAPGSFSGEAADRAFAEFLYFSLTTITTLGYGDITPLSATARVWAMLEALFGQFYIAVLVARLVGLYRG